jgi:hypothetical protein
MENKFNAFQFLNGKLLAVIDDYESRTELYRFKAEKATKEDDFESFLNLLYWGLIKKWNNNPGRAMKFRKFKFEFLGERKAFKYSNPVSLTFYSRNRCRWT